MVFWVENPGTAHSRTRSPQQPLHAWVFGWTVVLGYVGTWQFWYGPPASAASSGDTPVCVHGAAELEPAAAEVDEPPAPADDEGAAEEAGTTDDTGDAADDERALEEEEAGDPASRTPASTAPRHSSVAGTQPPGHTTRVAS